MRAPTADDLLDLPDDGRRHEVIRGELVVSPRERNAHLMAGRRLARQLDRQLPDGWVAEREVCLRLGDDGLVPDLVVMRDEPWSAASQVGLDPRDVALVVEVLSPSTRRRDLEDKPVLYAAAGLGSLWLLDLDPAPVLHPFVLEDGAYVPLPPVTSVGTVGIVALAHLGVGVTVDVTALQDGPARST